MIMKEKCRPTCATNKRLRGIMTMICIASSIPVILLSLYSLLASPPLHLFFDKIPHAGRNSVYVPGAGFSGFWYHLGLLQRMLNTSHHHGHDDELGYIFDSDTNYYCYSSGCLSLLLSNLMMSNTTYNPYRNNGMTTVNHHHYNSIVDIAYDAALKSQKQFLDGTIHQYQVVDTFLKTILLDPIKDYPHNNEMEQQIMNFLPQLNVLITSKTNGVQIRQARTILELIDLLRQTTWIPFITGNGFGMVHEKSTCTIKETFNATSFYHHDQQQEEMDIGNHNCEAINNNNNEVQTMHNTNNDWFLDGGFSRTLHPPCQHTISVPTTWLTTLHVFNPSMSRDVVMKLFQLGYNDYNGKEYATTNQHPSSQISDDLFQRTESMNRNIFTGSFLS